MVEIKADDKNLTLSNNKNENNSKNWPRSHGNHSSNKFSLLDQINSNNINSLDLAWTYKFSKKEWFLETQYSLKVKFMCLTRQIINCLRRFKWRKNMGTKHRG